MSIYVFNMLLVLLNESKNYTIYNKTDGSKFCRLFLFKIIYNYYL